MSPPSRFLFFADCGARIGGGHVMRSLTLAEALAGRGAACAFAAPPEAGAILRRFGSGAVAALPSPTAEVGGAVADAAALAGDWGADWIVIDHYRLERRHETALRRPGRRIAVIDDLAARPRDCDLVLDPSYGRTVAAYEGVAPPGAVILTGPAYALVRPEFAAARPAALARRGDRSARRALVALGLTDVGGVTGAVVQALLPHLGDIALDVVVGPGAPSLQGLAALAGPSLSLHVETRDMAALTAAADLAVGAGGSSAWERCCLGLPTLTLILADNQRPLALAFDRDGISPAVEAADLHTALVPAWRALATDPAARARLSAAGAALCDGLGAGRVAEALLGA